MIYSLSEIDAQVKKAARGAGFSWGHAEEAGKAVRYLVAQQLPGVVLLADYLLALETTAEPVNRCPIRLGAAVCDRGAQELGVNQSMQFHQLAYPLLLLPAVMVLSRQSGLPLQLRWAGVRLSCQGSRLLVDVDTREALSVPLAEAVILQVLPTGVSVGEEPAMMGQEIPERAWRVLERFAQLTYVPATEASRRGAGPAD